MLSDVAALWAVQGTQRAPTRPSAVGRPARASRVMKVVQAEEPSTVIAKAVQPLLLKAQVVVSQDLTGVTVGISRTFRLWCI